MHGRLIGPKPIIGLFCTVCETDDLMTGDEIGVQQICITSGYVTWLENFYLTIALLVAAIKIDLWNVKLMSLLKSMLTFLTLCKWYELSNH